MPPFAPVLSHGLMPAWFEACLYGLLGLVFGSFFGVVAHRVPEGRSIISPPSSCPACGHRLAAADLIPVLSYVLQRGRCRYCGTRFGIRYLAVEVASGALFVLAHYLAQGDVRLLLSGTLYLSLLLILFMTDLERMLLPDAITLPGIVLGLIVAVAGWGVMDWRESLLGAVVGYGILAVVRIAARGALGGGDPKMLALIGAFLGPVGALKVLFWASVVGSVVGIALIVTKRHDRRAPFPYGPFLALGATVVLAMIRLS